MTAQGSREEVPALSQPSPHAAQAPLSPAEFQKEAESEGGKKGKFKKVKVLKLLTPNKRDAKSKSPGDKS